MKKPSVPINNNNNNYKNYKARFSLFFFRRKFLLGTTIYRFIYVCICIYIFFFCRSRAPYNFPYLPHPDSYIHINVYNLYVHVCVYVSQIPISVVVYTCTYIRHRVHCKPIFTVLCGWRRRTLINKH